MSLLSFVTPLVLLVLEPSLSAKIENSALHLTNANFKQNSTLRPDEFNDSITNIQSRPDKNVRLDYDDGDFLKSSNSDYIAANNFSEYDDAAEPTTEEILEFIYPKSWTWALIFFHCVVFVVGLVGNCLVCVAVYRNHTMRTVTNYFIVNLAVADFLVILFCLPPSVVWDVTSTWWFGTALCKIVLYLQVSLSLKR